jgi:hypothetical protein
MAILLRTAEEGLNCPVCKQGAMSREEKLDIGPRTPRPCARCGASLSPAYSSVFVLVSPQIVALIGLAALRPSSAKWIGAAILALASFAATLLCWVRIPLVKR